MANTVPGFYVDGANVGYGTQLLTFVTASSGWTAENFTVQRPSQVAADYQAAGTPGRQRVTQDFITGSAILQAPSGAAGWPAFTDRFTITVDDNYGAETFAIDPTPYEATNDAGQLRKIPITFRKLNTGTFTVGPVPTPST